MTPTNTRASHGETAEEWITRAENVLRLTENAAEHAAGEAKAILLRNADELQHQIRVAKTELAELAGRTGSTGGRSCRV
jgi:transcription elongation GreA/GreB family factor